MNVLLIAPHACPCCTVIAPSVPLLLLQQRLCRQGVTATIFTPFLDDPGSCLEEVARGAYDMVVFSLFFSTMREDLVFFDAVRQRLAPDVPVLAEGMLAAHAVEHCLALGFDAVLAGYGPYILPEVCAALDCGPGLSLRELSIPGLAHAARPESRRRISSVEYAAMAHDDFLALDIPYERFWEVVRQRIPFLNHGPNKYTLRTARLETSICCHGACGFCATEYRSFCRKEERRSAFVLSPPQMLDIVMQTSTKHNVEAIVFTDVDFFHDAARARQFCDLASAAKTEGRLAPQVAFHAQTRAAHFILASGEADVALLAAARRAGFESITLGVETFNQRILGLPALNKAQCPATAVLGLFDAMLALELTPQCNLIFLQPDATAEEVMADIETMFTLVGKGVKCAGQPVMYATPGASILTHPRYDATSRVLASCRGETAYPDYVIPRDARCAAAAAGYKPVLAEERVRFKSLALWPHEEFSRTIDALLMGIALTRSLGTEDGADRLMKQALAFAGRG